jgi:hypothetical protein
MIYGLTENGFLPKPLAVIKDEIESDLRARIGESINLLPETVFAQIIGSYAEREETIWLQMEVDYTANSPSKATGTRLDDLVAINGIVRQSPSFSKIKEQALIGTLGTIIPAGTRFSVLGNDTSIFESDSEIILGAGLDAIQQISFSAIPVSGSFAIQYQSSVSPSIAFNASAGAVKAAIESLSGLSSVDVQGDFTLGFVVTFTNEDSKQPKSLLILASSTLQELGGGAINPLITNTQVGEYQGLVSLTAISAGSSFTAPARSLTEIVNAISGLNYAFNVEDAIVGRDLETDAELRIRRAQSLATGSGTTESIRAEIEDIGQEIEYAAVYENEEDFVVNTWEPHSIAVYVHEAGGLQAKSQEIGEAIFRKKAGGINTNGTESVVVTDSKGFDHTMKYFSAVEVPIYVRVNLTTNSSYPADGDNQLKQIIANRGNLLGVGVDVIVNPTMQSWIAQIAGITNVEILVGRSYPPTNNVTELISDAISPFPGVAEFSAWDETRIEII